MGLAIASGARYESAIKKLFPRGEYWDKQFADPASDASLFARAKLDALIRFRKRMGDLLDEGRPETADELIEDWERVQLGYSSPQLSLQERRDNILLRDNKTGSRIVIADIARTYGLSLIDIVFPFKPAFFGLSQYGRYTFSRPAFYSVFFIIVAFYDDAVKITARNHIAGLLNLSSFGRGCFGAGHFLNRFYFNKIYASSVFTEIDAVNSFERTISGILPLGNIPYFTYKF